MSREGPVTRVHGRPAIALLIAAATPGRAGATPFAQVTSRGGDGFGLRVINTATSAITTTVPLGRLSPAVAVDSAGGHISVVRQVAPPLASGLGVVDGAISTVA